jgi:hypothetical protein
VGTRLLRGAQVDAPLRSEEMHPKDTVCYNNKPLEMPLGADAADRNCSYPYLRQR